MSRSGYTDDCDHLELYRANVDRAISGKRGQKFLRELIAALDELPEKRLTQGALEAEGEVCALGALRRARGLELKGALEQSDWDALGEAFNVAPMLAREVMYENDEWQRSQTPEQRWERMRKWAESNLRPAQEPGGEKETR